MAKPKVEFNGIKNDPNAPVGANQPVASEVPTAETVAPKKAGRKPRAAKANAEAGNSDKLYVVKDAISGHIHSDPLPLAKAQDRAKLVADKEKREHPPERQIDIIIVEHGA